MVYCGKPSKGCSNCRERKIRVSHILEISSPGFDKLRVHGLASSATCPLCQGMLRNDLPSDDPTLKTKR